MSARIVEADEEAHPLDPDYMGLDPISRRHRDTGPLTGTLAIGSFGRGLNQSCVRGQEEVNHGG